MKYGKYEECPIENVLQIDSVFTWFRQKFADDYMYSGESHDFYEVVCVISGTVGVTAGKNVLMLPAGRMIVHEPNEFHNIWAAEGEPEVLICSFNASKFPCGSGVFTLLPDEVSELCDIYGDTEGCFDRSRDALRVAEGKAAQASATVKRLERVLINIISARRMGKSGIDDGSARTYRKIVSEMEKNVTKPLTTQSIAALCNISVSALEKTVRRFAGTGAMELFACMKLKCACKLLEQGSSVKDVAFSLGYSNPYYFSAVFKKRLGVTPSKWNR